MFSDLFSQEFSKTINTANIFGFPLIWNKKLKKLQFSRKYYSRTKLVQKLIYFHTFALIVETTRYKFTPNSPYFNLLLVDSYALVGMSVGTYVFSTQAEGIGRNWNSMFLYVTKFNEQFWNYPVSTAISALNRNLFKIIRPTNFMLTFLPIAMWSQIFLVPHHPIHLPNLFSNYRILFYIAHLIYTPAILYEFFFVTFFIKLMVQTFTAFILFILPVLREELALTRGPRYTGKFKCSPALGASPENLVLVYRSLQLLMKDLSILCGRYLPILNTLFAQLSISSGYVLIVEGRKTDDSMKMVLLVCVPFTVLVWAGFLVCVGKIQASSKECLTSWKVGAARWEAKEEKKYMAKFRKSCKPIYFGFEGFIVVTQKTVLKFMQGVVRGLFRALLALKKK
ncbi:hypothetical protein Fcan01_25084 [Folsomia candida]|uniref:Uncharacterized protein n=1 Tax=Folsomia candida TaxID=158441 RepID=A0A226D4S9_FOLCA|nr:hypothetical protein Fcan01_25084 [Folsomia candida]